MTTPRHMALATLVQGTGAHPASWMQTGTLDDASTSIEHFIAMARLAERGCFDIFFIADTPAARTDNLYAWSRFPMFMNVFEPITLLSALAVATKHIGLGATASTSFMEPYNLARQFASLDHLSHGRAAWNVVTSANDYAARNFGLDKLPPHAKRYDKAIEFVDVVEKLWDTWEDDAFVNDRKNGLNFIAEKQHPVDHDGEYFTVHGALNIARSPQGKPVIIQAGASETGKDFAARTAEVVFASDPTVEKGKVFYDDLKARVVKFGRSADSLKILTGLSVVIGATTEEAEAKYQHLQSMIHPDVGRMRLAQDLETDLSDLPLDEPIPESRIPAVSNFHKAYFDYIVSMIREEKLTLREMCMRYERGNVTFRGTATQVADHMQEWLEAGAADGFMMIFHTMPGGMQDFVEHVVPLLQERDLMKREYTGTTLRDHLGLSRPTNRHAK
ncbi:LLM class flavin-dependent oxidoreductase [Pseudomonas sp. dw_358]|uniref:LLM class flavin-dependent oxidoreductase n=1 Tax=Pseudomonas sp. dw_358 TaxID=2720083 RepID=UPI001BD30209|nr:LLM class flavin-dependent oxidoreductase [Pseudomonas sp. dw_358]